MDFSKAEISGHIAARLARDEATLRDSWNVSQPVSHFVVDDLLPDAFARQLSESFPDTDHLMLYDTWKQRKHVGVQVSEYSPNVGNTLFAFQAEAVHEVIERITGIAGLDVDPSLYASGISTMLKGDFLNPHLDNSHDGDNDRYRVINTLFYISPNWADENGGQLEVWDDRVERPHEISVRFNRLVVMATNPTSWHSVKRVTSDAPRMCVSNYYFSHQPPGGKPFSHVTTFAGRPEQRLLRSYARLDAFAINLAGRLFLFLTRRNKHRIRVGE